MTIGEGLTSRCSAFENSVSVLEGRLIMINLTLPIKSRIGSVYLV